MPKPVIQIELDETGLPIPMFCSICGEWEEMVAYFLSGRVEVSMCSVCNGRIWRFFREIKERTKDAL